MSSTTPRTAVVSGAASGLGAEIARDLAALGWRVVIACRNLDRGERVATGINSAAPPGAGVVVMRLDTADPESVRQFATQYRANEGPLDVLVNNAGALFADRAVAPRGLELTFGTNVLGYYLLAMELLPALRAAEGARIVNVASTFAFGLDLDDLQFERRPYDGMTAYAQSKACDRLLTYALARRLSDTAITCNAVAPGLMLDTELYRRLPAEAKGDLAQYGSRSIRAGADTPVWLASSADVEGVTGQFFEDREARPCEFRGREAEDRLWSECQRLTAPAHAGTGSP